jgi:hypothetical protein
MDKMIKLIYTGRLKDRDKAPKKYWPRMVEILEIQKFINQYQHKEKSNE